MRFPWNSQKIYSSSSIDACKLTPIMQFLHTTKYVEKIGAKLFKDTCLVARLRKPRGLQRLALENL